MLSERHWCDTDAHADWAAALVRGVEAESVLVG